MTAAATTGPKSDPRPTSSAPATSFAPVAQARFSNLRVQRSLFSRRSFAAAGERPGVFGSLDRERTGASSIFAEDAEGCKSVECFAKKIDVETGLAPSLPLSR